jgi:type II pantothenate kinase
LLTDANVNNLKLTVFDFIESILINFILKGFDEILELAEKGDNKLIDMLVRDIYGTNYESLGLSDDLIASSLGKATRSIFDNNCTREELLTKFKQEDIVKSILLMICYDVSQIASLYARLYNVNKVFFGGYFIHGSEITMKFLKHGISYWSQVLNLKLSIVEK